VELRSTRSHCKSRDHNRQYRRDRSLDHHGIVVPNRRTALNRPGNTVPLSVGVEA
jgi:hypothetical protein